MGSRKVKEILRSIRFVILPHLAGHAPDLPENSSG